MDSSLSGAEGVSMPSDRYSNPEALPRISLAPAYLPLYSSGASAQLKKEGRRSTEPAFFFFGSLPQRADVHPAAPLTAQHEARPFRRSSHEVRGWRQGHLRSDGRSCPIQHVLKAFHDELLNRRDHGSSSVQRGSERATTSSSPQISLQARAARFASFAARARNATRQLEGKRRDLRVASRSARRRIARCSPRQHIH